MLKNSIKKIVTLKGIHTSVIYFETLQNGIFHTQEIRTAIYHYLSELQTPKGRNHAHRCVRIFLRVRKMPHPVEAKRRRLLCFLQLRNG